MEHGEAHGRSPPAAGAAVMNMTMRRNHMEDQMNQPGTMPPAPQKPKRPVKSQRKGGRLYTIEEANTFAASMCAMSDETKLSDALEIADSTGNAFVYKGGRLMGVVLSCDKYAEVSKGK